MTCCPTALPSPHLSQYACTFGVELQLAGDYMELERYLRDLEQAWPELHWGEMRLQSPGHGEPSLLQLQLI